MDKNLRENTLNFLKQTLADMLIESKNEKLNNELCYVVADYDGEFYVDVIDNGEAGKKFVAKVGKPKLYTEAEATALVEEIGGKHFGYNSVGVHSYRAFLNARIESLSKTIDFLTGWTAQ